MSVPENKRSLLVIDCPLNQVPHDLLSSCDILNLSGEQNVKDSEGVARLDVEGIASIRLQAMDEVKNFSVLSIGGKTIAEHLKFNNSSIYFFHRLKIYQELATLLVKAEEVKLQCTKFKKIEIYSTSQFLLRYFEDNEGVAGNKVVDVSERKSYSSLISFSWRFLVRALKGYAQRGRRTKFDLAIVDRPCDYVAVNGGFENPFVGDLIDQLDQEVLRISEIPINRFKGEKRFKADPRYKLHSGLKNVVYGEHILWRTLLSLRREWKANCRYLLNQLNSIESGLSDFQSRFIWARLKGLQSTTELYVLKEMAYHKFFLSSSLKSLIASDENSLANRVILNAAKHCRIKTFGIQHGAIGNTSANYMYCTEDFKWSPVPDLTLVWGDFWKNLLSENGNYPESTISVVGQLRTDRIFKLSSVQQEPNLFVFASQPIPDEAYRERALMDVLNVAANHPEMNVIIKPHPREKDLSYFLDRIQAVGCKNVKVQPEADLYDLLAKCRVLITCYSTVAIEALYFRKQVVLLDYRGEDFLEFGKLNLAEICSSRESFKSALLKTGDEERRNKNDVEEFIRERACKIDGEVVSRTLEVINLHDKYLIG